MTCSLTLQFGPLPLGSWEVWSATCLRPHSRLEALSALPVVSARKPLGRTFSWGCAQLSRWLKCWGLHGLSLEHLHRHDGVKLMEVQTHGGQKRVVGVDREMVEGRQTAGMMDGMPFHSVVWARYGEWKRTDEKRWKEHMHVGMSQICRLCAHVWPYITSASPPLLSSCCGPISLAAALLEVAKPPREPASLLSLTFPFSFSCYIEHTSGISSFPLNRSISLHRKKKKGNLFFGHKRFHSPTGVSRWIWQLEVWVWASGPLGVGEGGLPEG